MKKLMYGILCSSILLLTACGGNEDSSSTSSNEEETVQETTQTETVETTDDKNEEKADENVEENDQIKVVYTYKNKELGIVGETGPIKYEIPAVQLSEITPKTEEAANLFETTVGEKVYAITIDMNGENTSEEDISFYLGQATIITNTKEQLDPDMFLSEHIEGDYLGQVRHEGHNVYILKNSTVEDLKTIEVRVDAPINSNFDTVGQDIKHVIEVNK